MSLQPFPEIIDVRKFFSQQAHIKALLPLHSLKRLEKYLNKAEVDSNSALAVDLEFTHDDEDRLILEGKMEGALSLPCQRCLQGVEYKLTSDFRVQVLDELKVGGDRELAEDELEVVLSLEGKLDILALVEDEVILSLPLVIYHAEADCNQILVDLQEKGRRNLETKTFAELEVLKKQLNSDKGKIK